MGRLRPKGVPFSGRRVLVKQTARNLRPVYERVEKSINYSQILLYRHPLNTDTSIYIYIYNMK